MTYEAFLEGVAARAKEHERRAVAASEGLTSEQFNKPAGREWSVARVYKHLCLADEPYLMAIEGALSRAPTGSGDVKHSFVGKMLMKASGPGGNAPSPAFLIPPALALSAEVIEEWKRYRGTFLRLVESAKGKDLKVGVKNPFIKFLPMKLADLFAVIDVHTERHVRQIEERSRLVRNA